MAVELVRVRWSAAPGSTVRLSESGVRSGAEAVTVTEPASSPLTVLVATPAEAVEPPRPESEPLPAVWAKVTVVVLSVAIVLPAASWMVAVRTRLAPELRLAVEPLIAIFVGVPGSTVKVVVSAVRPAAVAWIVIEPARSPVTVFDATPEAAVAAPRPVTVPAPAVLAKVTAVELSPRDEVVRRRRGSRRSASRAEPEARLAVELVTVR